MGDHEKPVVQDIWYTSQRVIRTAVQVLLAGVTVIATIAVLAPQVLDAVKDVLPGPVVVWLGTAIAFIAALAAALARVMAIPMVNRWLTAIGAGSVPASGHSAGTEPGRTAAEPLGPDA